MTITLNRRSVLAGAACAVGVGLLPSALVARTGAGATEADVAVDNQRSMRVFAWAPARPRVVALFSHGYGATPERYAVLVDVLRTAGFAVLAPRHVDSMQHPDKAKYPMPATFAPRMADLRALSVEAARRYPGLPVVAVGHSYGTLASLCLGGATTVMGALRDPRVRAVLGFSTPGRIAGLMPAEAYASVAVPLLLVTGTRDVVPGLVPDPADHLLPVTSGRGPDRYALNVRDGDHGLVSDAARMAAIRPLLGTFLHGYGLDDSRARRTMARYRAAAGDSFIAGPR